MFYSVQMIFVVYSVKLVDISSQATVGDSAIKALRDTLTAVALF